MLKASEFGRGVDRDRIRTAIFDFIAKWKESRSTTYTLWVTYPNDTTTSEDEFEKKMWEELSALTSVEEREEDWSPKWSMDPESKRFTLCVGGHAFFVVGLHPQSSREGRKFPYPALIFNVYDQFEDLMSQNAYVPMVNKNRERDSRFSGSVNPMAERHGDEWETIQFSGKTNSDQWRCPFHFKSRDELKK
jgi:FPC/CPF motif-containing protein YcgG